MPRRSSKSEGGQPDTPGLAGGLHSTSRLRDTQPVIAVFLGGDTRDYQMTNQFAESLIEQVLDVCEQSDGVCLVTTSRRTPPAVERWLSERLSDHPRCPLLLLASRDALEGTMEGMLAWAEVVVVTGESVSMISEACASGRPVLSVDLPLRRARHVTKSHRYLTLLAQQDYLRRCALPELGATIRRCITERPAVKRLETYATVREAVSRLL